jgi:ferredoxin-NADP reductase
MPPAPSFVAPQPGRLLWQEATITAIAAATPRVKIFTFRPPAWHGFTAGQHVDIRLTAPDGYQAERSYSIASAPDAAGTFDLAIDLIDDGEVSPFFHEVAEVGDTIEMRGPIGGHFVWRAENGGPLLLIGGGSGLVPLMAILRHRAVAAPEIPAALILSARSEDELIWRDELLRRARDEAHFHLFATVTREAPRTPGIGHGHLDAKLVAAALASLPAQPSTTFLCGSTPFVGAAAELALSAGIPFDSIKAERYGG